MTFVDETRFDLAVWLSRVAVYTIMPKRDQLFWEAIGRRPRREHG